MTSMVPNDLTEAATIEGQLERSLGQVTLFRSQVRKTLESPSGQLLVAIKQASSMLNELRTPKLPPQPYYELYNACFDTLSQLEEYLIEDHKNHHLADVYEIVQYTATVLPRLYLMITVGTAFLATPDSPRQEVLKDMLEMSRGIQSPLKGLFLRYYLAQRTGSYLMTNTKRELEFSVQFTLTNFIEMNKLWVRYQHDGLSKSYDQRIEERKQLKTIVGSSILRLSQLDAIDLAFFGNIVLPALLDQVVQCRDKLAQEYLLDVIVQVFPAEYHLETLSIFLNCLNSLVPQSSVALILQASINRIIGYTRNLESERADSKLVEDLKYHDIQNQQIDGVEIKSDEAVTGDGAKNNEGGTAEVEKPAHSTEVEPATKEQPASGDVSKSNGGHIDEITTSQDKKDELQHEKVTSDMTNEAGNDGKGSEGEEKEDPLIRPVVAEYWNVISVQNVSSRDRATMISSLIELCEVTDTRVPLDDLFKFIVSGKIDENMEIEKLIISLFNSKNYSITELLELLGRHPAVLSSQSKETRHKVAEYVINQFLVKTRHQSSEVYESTSNFGLAKQVLDLMTLLLNSGGFDAAKMRLIIDLLKTDKIDSTLELLTFSQEKMRSSGAMIVQKTSAIIITATLELLREGPTAAEVSKILKFCNKACYDLATIGSSPLEAYRLYIVCGIAADNIGSESAAYELFVQSLSIYEEHFIDSIQQVIALAVIIQALQQTTVFTSENYEPLAQRCMQYAQRLMKKPDQCRSLLKVAHLYWDNNYADARRVEETLSRALRSADSVMDIGTSIELFLDVLDANLYFLSNDVSTVTAGSVNSIVKLINKNLDTAFKDGLPSDIKSQASLGSLKDRWSRTVSFITSQAEAFPRFQGLAVQNSS